VGVGVVLAVGLLATAAAGAGVVGAGVGVVVGAGVGVVAGAGVAVTGTGMTPDAGGGEGEGLGGKMIGGGDGAPGAGTESNLGTLTLPAGNAQLLVMLFESIRIQSKAHDLKPE